MSYNSYYYNQVGSGLAGFQGLRYQKGHGFFGRLFSGVGNFMKQLAPNLGKRALTSGIGLAQDILSGENVGRSALSRLKEAGTGVADETLDLIKSRLQSGRGIKRKRKRIKKSIKPIKRRRKINKKRRKSKLLKFLK